MEFLTQYIFQISEAVEILSFSVMIYGAILALLHFLRAEVKRITGKFDITMLDIVRHDFAYYILLGLEFLIAADIIQTILRPTQAELIELGGIVVIRVVLSYFLNKEIEELKKTHPSHKKGE